MNDRSAPMQPVTAAAAERMVESQIEARGVRDPRVLAAMREVPRDAFVPEDQGLAAYDDGPLPIGEGQTISQPYVVALMAEAAEVAPGDRVLDVGTGSGYAAAVLARLAARVCSIERHAALAEAARERLAGLGYANVEVRVGRRHARLARASRPRVRRDPGRGGGPARARGA
jgi:protein-L-isoaspartate(D-aspartate) O-methyltransferase